MTTPLPTLEEILRQDDEHLARQYGNPDVQEFVRARPDYVRRNWYAQPSERELEREEETLP